MSAAESEFRRLLGRHVLPHYHLTDVACARLEQHQTLLTRWNQRINLTAIRDVEEAVLRHYGESVALASMLPPGALRIVDAGSGAGFPGIPIAILRPECHVTLVELDIRKSVFLREASLDLPNCRVFQGRLTALTPPSLFDWLVSRALHWQELRMFPHAANVALLLSDAQATEITRDWPQIAWSAPQPLPWPGQGVVMMGSSRTQHEG